MRNKAKSLTLALALFFTAAISFANDLVVYEFTANTADGWDVSVNGKLVVKHRPASKGHKMYAGSLGDMVTNGVNSVSLVRFDSAHGGIAATPDAVALKIEYGANSQPRTGGGRVLMDLRTGKSVSREFVVDGIRVDKDLPTAAGRVAQTGDGLKGLWERRPHLVVLGAWAVFINLCGFLIIGVDRRKVRTRGLRYTSSQFVWNVLLGGAPGQFIGMAVWRHIPENAMSFVVATIVFVAQIAGIWYLNTPAGRKLVNDYLPEKARAEAKAPIRKVRGFLDNIDAKRRRDNLPR